jgi:hypothetical protein
VSSLRSFALVLASSSLAAACIAADTTTPDDLAGTTAADGVEDGKADASGTYTYYSITADVRKCQSPLCGGHFVSRVNLGSTKCADGVYRDACYVADVDLSGLGLSDLDLAKVTELEGAGGQQLILRGTIGAQRYGAGTLGVFHATEAWIAGTDGTPDGVVVKVRDNGVRCFAAPCASLTEHKLDSSRSAKIADVDYAPSGASERQIEAAIARYSDDGVIIAGDRYTVHENGRTAKGRTATQYWTRVVPATN